MNEIDELFKKRDAQWAAYCKKRDRNNRRFKLIITAIVVVVIIIAVSA